MQTIKPFINSYYLDVVSEMIARIKASEAGKRYWTSCPVTGYNDYSMTQRSTFPDWCKFYYVRTPKRERIEYILDAERKPFEDGYFNGSTKDLISILERHKKDICQKRKESA